MQENGNYKQFRRLMALNKRERRTLQSALLLARQEDLRRTTAPSPALAPAPAPTPQRPVTPPVQR